MSDRCNKRSPQLARGPGNAAACAASRSGNDGDLTAQAARLFSHCLRLVMSLSRIGLGFFLLVHEPIVVPLYDRSYPISAYEQYPAKKNALAGA